MKSTFLFGNKYLQYILVATERSDTEKRCWRTKLNYCIKEVPYDFSDNPFDANSQEILAVQAHVSPNVGKTTY